MLWVGHRTHVHVRSGVARGSVACVGSTVSIARCNRRFMHGGGTRQGEYNAVLHFAYYTLAVSAKSNLTGEWSLDLDAILLTLLVRSCRDPHATTMFASILHIHIKALLDPVKAILPSAFLRHPPDRVMSSAI